MSEEDEDRKQEIENLKYSYNQTMDIFRMNNDNYFKRIQVIMVVLQAGLFVAFMRLVSPIPSSWNNFPMPIIVTVLGAFIAVLWIVFMDKQKQYLELLKRHLRNLEMEFKSRNVPLDYFTIESAVAFKDIEEEIVQKINEDIKGKEIKMDSNGNYYVSFKWSGHRYPDSKKQIQSKRAIEVQWFAKYAQRVGIGKYNVHEIDNVKGGLVKTEEWLSKGTFWFWSILFILLIGWLIYCQLYPPSCC